jgi:hypothetical protein
MSVLIRVGKQKAILRAGSWLAADPRLERRLNAQMRRWFQTTGGPALVDDDQEGAVAREIARQLGGRVLLQVRSRSPSHARAYIRHRQLAFDFADAL